MSGPDCYRSGRRRREPKCEVLLATHAQADNAFKNWLRKQAERPSTVKFIPKRR